jgi:hypothetical protein
MDPDPERKAADERSHPRRKTDARAFDFDPEDPQAGADRDGWLRDNVPPHHG